MTAGNLAVRARAKDLRARAKDRPARGMDLRAKEKEKVAAFSKFDPIDTWLAVGHF